MKRVEVPDRLYRPNVWGVLGGLVNIGGFVGGVYHGIKDAKGIAIAPNLESFLMYAPAITSGLCGMKFGAKMMKDKDIVRQMREHIDSSAPSYIDESQKQAAQGCQSGCSTIVSGAGGAAFSGLITLMGYGIGTWVGNQV